MKKHLFLLAIVLSLTSCKQLLLTAYGVTAPQIESYATLSNYADKKGMNMAGKLCAPKDSSQLYLLFEKSSVPDALIFNANGHFVDYRENPESCNAGIDAFIEGLATNDTLQVDNTILASDLLQRLIMLPNKQAVTFDGSYDYTIVMTWLKWTGRTTPDHIIPWQASIARAEKNGLTIRTLYLNLDFMDYMGFENPSVELE